MSWYLADLVVRFDVQDDPRGVVHINRCLVEAHDAEEAYVKATALGTDPGDLSSLENPEALDQIGAVVG